MKLTRSSTQLIAGIIIAITISSLTAFAAFTASPDKPPHAPPDHGNAEQSPPDNPRALISAITPLA
jgi:hypothetical protein